MSKQGTEMWCPNCRKQEICRSISPSSICGNSEMRFRSSKDPGLNWLRRGRECQECGHEFLTAEVEERFVHELSAVRGELSEVKKENERLTKLLETLPSEFDTRLALDALKNISRYVEELREYKPIADLAESIGE